MKDSGVIKIANVLAKIRTLLSIDLSDNNFADNSTYSVAAAFKENPLLEHLCLRKCYKYNVALMQETQEKGIGNIFTPFITYLRHLDLHSCHINDNAAESLAILIANNKSLSYLELTDCNLQDKGLIDIACYSQVSFLKLQRYHKCGCI